MSNAADDPKPVEGLDKFTLLACPRCGQGRIETPDMWRRFWAAHPPELAERPEFLEVARAWFAACGQPQALDRQEECPLCKSREHVAKWLVKGVRDAGGTSG